MSGLAVSLLKGAGVAGVATAAGSSATDHAVPLAIITTLGGLITVGLTQFLPPLLRRHSRERAEITLSKQVTEMYEAEIVRKDQENERLTRRVEHLEAELDGRRP